MPSDGANSPRAVSDFLCRLECCFRGFSFSFSSSQTETKPLNMLLFLDIKLVQWCSKIFRYFNIDSSQSSSTKLSSPTFKNVYWLKPVPSPPATPLLASRASATLAHASLTTLNVCSAEGCPGLCNNNGRCTLEASGWHCICQSGWRGAGCHVAMETLCADGKDNEGGEAGRKVVCDLLKF